MHHFERRHEPLLPRRIFYRRVLTFFIFSVVIIGCSLGLGILGYHFTENLSWIDSLLNASMILGGMGPVDPIQTVAGKLFASFYALFSGMVFLVAVGVLIAPVVHRLLHSFHVAPDDVQDAEQKSEPASKGRQRRSR